MSALLLVMAMDASHDDLIKGKKSVGGYVYKNYWNLSIKTSGSTTVAANLKIRLRALQLAIVGGSIDVMHVIQQVHVTLSAFNKISDDPEVNQELKLLVSSVKTAVRRFDDVTWQRCRLYVENYVSSLCCERDEMKELEVS